MERVLSVEEKIRRAEEIYEKRRLNNEARVSTVDINKEKKEFKLFKKMIIQIIICTFFYLVIQTINNSNYVFSEDFINKTKEILSYDTNFSMLYENVKDFIQNIIKNKDKQDFVQEGQDEPTKEEQNQLENIQQSDETIISEANNDQQLSQEEQDISNVKNTTNFIKPIEGIITSKFGVREATTETMPKNHTGIDIAANVGTKIKASTEGEVVLVSEEGDYGKHLKIQIGEVSIIYAHCNNLYVKQGEKIFQGQEIAEVGSTGNSTGPHLHFEIRFAERTVNPEKILIF